MGCQISYDGDSVTLETTEELFVALDILPTIADKEILWQIGSGIITIVTNDDEFLKIMSKALGTKGTSKKPYLETFQNNLSKVVTKGETVSRALAQLADESDQEYFLKTLGKENLQKCLFGLDDITECLEWLYGKMDRLFLDIIGWDFLINRIHIGQDLGRILRYLTGEEEKTLIEKMTWEKILECIQTEKDLLYVLSGMDAVHEETLIEKTTPSKLKQIFPTEQALIRISKRHLSKSDGDLLLKKYRGA